MPDNRVTEWVIPGSGGQPIYGNTHLPGGEPAGVLICAHGFKGYKDYGFIPALCRHAADAGLIAHRFNFSHSGMTNRIETFERADLFENDRWSRQIEDLGHVFAIAQGDASLPRVLFGHSRGGVASTLFAGRNRPEMLAGLIAAAAPDYACNLDESAREQLRAEGRLLSPSGRTGQALYVGAGWLEEIERDPAGYDPIAAASRVACPMLILHGDADETVPASCAMKLHAAATPRSTLAVVRGANHVFNAPNPLPADTPIASYPLQTRELVRRSIDFALRCCAGHC